MSKRRNKPTWAFFKEMVHAGGGHWMTQLYHYAGAFCAFLASRVGMTPNHLTLLSGLLTPLTMGVMLYGIGKGIVWALLVVALLMFSYSLDCADGQLARATKQTSKYGAWLDHVLDSGKIFIVNFSVGWMLITKPELFEMSISLAFLAMVMNITGASIYFFAWNYKVMIAGEDLISRLSDESTSNRVRLMKFYHQFTDYGWFPLIFILLAFPSKFAQTYLFYGCGTFLIFSGYLIVSANYMKKLES
ncbi:MAG: CDP-alcohol phosphatidyltransferase family protein [Rubritalea sp.]|tara:strand:+ start:1349 stop:2086 length:738 start_codon:yes stop_codon:yes gene_type:complete